MQTLKTEFWNGMAGYIVDSNTLGQLKKVTGYDTILCMNNYITGAFLPKLFYTKSSILSPPGLA